jgi:3'(2'), 5'-bisphosphate nucleotidase
MTQAIGSRELAALCDIALAAGREIMQVYEAGSTRATASTSKDDGSPLTEADLRADKVIRARLEREFPGVFILSEESGDRSGRAVPEFFLVDPLDGTKEFLNRNGEFTVNIAFVSQGAPVAGVVFAPALGELYQGAKGSGAFKGLSGEAKPIAVGTSQAGRALRVMGSRSHGTDAMGVWLQALGRPHEFVAAGSSLKFCRIAEGLADVYPRMGPTSQWDTAAGQAVLEAAGGAVTDASGAPLRYGVERAILNPYFIAVGRVQFTLPPIG